MGLGKVSAMNNNKRNKCRTGIILSIKFPLGITPGNYKLPHKDNAPKIEVPLKRMMRFANRM